MAEALKERYPFVFDAIKVNLEAYGVKVETINTTHNIWVRDYMPVQVGDHFVRFQYKTVGYEKYPQLKIDDTLWMGKLVPVIQSPIVLDGGNCVRGYGKAIITSKVLKDNPEKTPMELLAEMERLLECQVILIPIEPGDTLGHSDGICKFVDEKTMLINDYSSIYDKDSRFKRYTAKLHSIFSDAGFSVEILPYAYGDWDWDMSEKEFRKRYPEADDFNPGFGYYINFLVARSLILAPVMGIKKDTDVIKRLLQLYPQHSIVAINCKHLSMCGGLINCVTMNYT